MFTRKPDPRDALIADLLKERADMLDRFQELVGSVHSHQVALHSRDMGDTWRQPPSITGQEASWVGEDETDLNDLHEEGTIDEGALRAALAEAGYQNTNVFFEE